MDVMRELVREDHFDLVFGIVGEQRVGQQDAPRLPMPASAALAFLVWPLNTHSNTPTTSVRALRRQRHQPIDERRAIERLELVEDRQQDDRRSRARPIMASANTAAEIHHQWSGALAKRE